MKFLFKKNMLFFIFSFICGCGFSMKISEMPVSNIAKNVLRKELGSFNMDEEEIEKLISNETLTTKEKIKKIARKGTIRDIVLLLWVLNRNGQKLPQISSSLHSASQIFQAKREKNTSASFECMEASMLAAIILREKNIDAYLLHMNGLNFAAGHTVCVYRTKLGWATIGIGSYDSMQPAFLLESFERSINRIFRYATRERWFTRNIIIYSMRKPEEINDDFINKGAINLFWFNMATFFRGRWF